MFKLFFVLILVFPLRLFALELKVGDILLQPLNCWSCSLIEAQEETIYSHVGMVLEVGPSVKVAEALGSVRVITLEAFRARNEKGQLLSVRRLKDPIKVKIIQEEKQNFQNYFRENYSGLGYDHDFLWDNRDESGQEVLYCSEFITKIFHGFLGLEIPVKPMRFDINRDLWLRYFKGNPPDGERGNSPGDLERSTLFYEVGKL